MAPLVRDVSLSRPRLAELESQVDENELARLLDEFQETALQIEEDTLAWGEVRKREL